MLAKGVAAVEVDADGRGRLDGLVGRAGAGPVQLALRRGSGRRLAVLKLDVIGLSGGQGVGGGVGRGAVDGPVVDQRRPGEGRAAG